MNDGRSFGLVRYYGFVAYWSPKDAATNAKAIVWGLIAGFSERFVPDILNRLSSENTKEKV